ncbi:hypothetical protein EVAR_10719_1 [Eumeta japonica]|uniref:Uncharacterized protein n=1 Tax=Eumeta variegata TaxID=151549 RepID=A0A4C1U7B4_EUMVA|nr:hypothetical protein EVAR_10719_1 [Eumeta japonica]
MTVFLGERTSLIGFSAATPAQRLAANFSRVSLTPPSAVLHPCCCQLEKKTARKEGGTTSERATLSQSSKQQLLMMPFVNTGQRRNMVTCNPRGVTSIFARLMDRNKIAGEGGVD